MVEIFGKHYFIDLDRITEKCRIDSRIVNEEDDDDDTEDNVPSINLFKYEIIKLCIETILTENSEVDESLGVFGNATSTSVSFKFAFNTLIKNEILIDEDE